MLAQAPNDCGTRGSILLIGSVTRRDPVPELFATHAYAAAKGALTALMTTMAATYAPDRIRVNLVAPSLTATPMAARAAGDARSSPTRARKQPLAGEMLDPDEVAQAAVFFLSDESRAVTGQLLKVDGGWSVASVVAGAGTGRTDDARSPTCRSSPTSTCASSAPARPARRRRSRPRATGASVLLVDRLPFLGGTSTAVLDTFYGFWTPGDGR